MLIFKINCLRVQPCTQQHQRHTYIFISVIYNPRENRRTIMLENTEHNVNVI